MPARTFLLLLILPSAALVHITTRIHWHIPAIYQATISLITYLLYRQDKVSAGCNAKRIRESTLHTAALLGAGRPHTSHKSDCATKPPSAAFNALTGVSLDHTSTLPWKFFSTGRLHIRYGVYLDNLGLAEFKR